MATTARWQATLWRAPARCAWSGCGQAAGVDVLVTVPGEPPPLAVRIGGYCVGHAVIVGIDTQARHGGELWYAARLDAARCDLARSN
jgi:hypothetical protein